MVTFCTKIEHVKPSAFEFIKSSARMSKAQVMERILSYLAISLMVFLILGSCGSYKSLPATTNTEPRIIILDGGDTISEIEFGGFNSWYCKDFVNGGRTLVEVGYFGDPYLKGLGFILFDGGNKGEGTEYYRAGLDHRWNWGPNMTDYSFIVKPDGTGLYYDFTSVPKGEITKARDVYKCYQR